MTISENLKNIGSALPSTINLVIAVKYANLEQIKELIQLNVKNLGFNTLQQLLVLKKHLPSNIKLHFIGHLQRNKVKKLLESEIHLIQSIDSLKLARKINQIAEELNIIQNILIQVKTDPCKEYGFTQQKIKDACNTIKNEFKNINIQGLMTIPSRCSVEDDFRLMKRLFDELEIEFNLRFLSMGMSGDYELAINNGANMIRLGSVIFK